jgi:pimeloyl-ACP methyl ester carboxylesterase
MSMPFLNLEQINFHYIDQGEGIPFFFLHGLGGDLNQPLGLFKPPPGIRLISFDFRAHGNTDLGDPNKLSITQFADDLLAIMDALSIERAIVGGISMGAAVSLNFALRYPARILGLIISRPAWLEGPMESENRGLFAEIAQLLLKYEVPEGMEKFKSLNAYHRILETSQDTANSLLGQFTDSRSKETVIKLINIPSSSSSSDRSQWRNIRVPTLVLINELDPIHPAKYGKIYEEEIPEAVLMQITPKSISAERHVADVQLNIERFLEKIKG